MLRDMFPEEMEEKLQIVIEEAKGEIDDAVERLLCPDHTTKLKQLTASTSKQVQAPALMTLKQVQALAMMTSKHVQAPTLMMTVPCVICCLHIRPSLLIFPGFLSLRSAVNTCGGRR